MNEKITAITVCVDYGDILSVVLPRNKKHFNRVVVVSHEKDTETKNLCSSIPGVELFLTNVFYENGAKFNKGAAIEQVFDYIKRDGWICVLDADILLPSVVDFSGWMSCGNLYSPRRRMLDDTSKLDQIDFLDWSSCPVRNDIEFCGYFQLFHSDDPVLRERPWYGIDYVHAGGGDHDFEMKWNCKNKIRPYFDVVHIGPSDVNWFGRAMPKKGDTETESQQENRAIMERFLRSKGWGRKKDGTVFQEKINNHEN